MCRVLIVDDDEELLFLIGKFMEAKGIDFKLAGSAEQARMHLSQTRFDLLISDLKMPGESGFDLFGYVSSHHPGVRFAIMSGYDDYRTKSKARGMGIDGYIEKPFSFLDLLQIVKNLAPLCLPETSHISAA